MNRAIAAALAAVSGLAFAGCAAPPTERNFGESVRQMIRAQTLNPDEPSHDEPVDATDGPLLENALEAYRGDVADREAVGEGVQIDVGGGTGQ